MMLCSKITRDINKLRLLGIKRSFLSKNMCDNNNCSFSLFVLRINLRLCQYSQGIYPLKVATMSIL